VPTWKVLVIVALACVCLALALSTLVIGVAKDGSNRWLWTGGLLAATIAAGTLFASFLRYAGRSLDASPRGVRR
jgi:hypothetical protein